MGGRRIGVRTPWPILSDSFNVRRGSQRLSWRTHHSGISCKRLIVQAMESRGMEPSTSAFLIPFQTKPGADRPRYCIPDWADDGRTAARHYLLRPPAVRGQLDPVSRRPRLACALEDNQH